MKRSFLRKTLHLISVVAILAQSFTPYVLLVPQKSYAQEVVQEEVTPTTPASNVIDATVEQATPTEVATPTPESNAADAAAEEITPTPTDTVAEEISPTLNESLITPTEGQINNLSPPANGSQIQGDATPDEAPTGNEELNIIVLENVSAPSIDLEAFGTQGSASLTTDKPDYAPTDTAFITGSNLNPNTSYTLRVWSDDEPPTGITAEVTSDENGVFAYAYQLDGTYRPNYSAELKDSAGNVVASTTFTDTDTSTLTPNGQGLYTNWGGDESDIDETSSVSCTSNDYVIESVTGDRESVLINLSSIPNGSTITSITVNVWDRGDDVSGGTYQTFVRLNGSNTDSGSNLSATGGSGDPCSGMKTQIINVPDVSKSGSTTLEIGVLKTATNTNMVRVGAIRAFVTYTEALSPAWPTSWTTPQPCSVDPAPEASVGVDEIDLIGDGVNPAVGFTTDSNFRYFRERVNGNPGSFNQKAWVVLFQTVAPQYQYIVSVNGHDDKVQLWQNTTPAVPGIVDFLPLLNDPAETKLWEGNTSVYARTINAGGGIYYVDWAIPKSELVGTGIDDSTTKYFATSADANNFNKDYLNCYEAPANGHLIVQKTTVPAGDQTQFSINAASSNGGTVVGGGAGTVTDATDKDYEVTAGTYSVTETVPNGWTQTSNTCTNVVVALGETKYCTITNTQSQGTIELKKDFVGTPTGVYINIGTSEQASDVYSDWILGDGTSGEKTVNTGNYYVSETLPIADLNLYVKTLACYNDVNHNNSVDGGDTAHTVTAGTGQVAVGTNDDVICVFTNTRNQGTIELKKIWSGTGGQTTLRIGTSSNGSQTDSQLTGINGAAPLTTGQNTVNTDTYYVSETGGLTNYTPSLACFNDVNNNGVNNSEPTVSVGVNNSVSVGVGQHVICTFTNTLNTATLKLAKTVDYGPAQPGDWTLTASGNGGFSDNGASTTFHTVNINTPYTLSESSIPGWSQFGNWQCNGGSLQGSVITLSSGQNVTCTIVNHRDMGSVKVNKKTDINGDGDWNDSNDEGSNQTTANNWANAQGFRWVIDGVPNTFGTT